MKTKWSDCFVHQFTLNFNNSASYIHSGRTGKTAQGLIIIIWKYASL